jgi:hypothetical protein
MKQYKVNLGSKSIPLSIDADFMHVKDGLICLYHDGKGGSKPEMIAAFSSPAIVYEDGGHVKEL